MMRTILLATDGSSCSERALQHAAALAKSFHARVIVLHAYLQGSEPVVDGGLSVATYETRRQADEVAGQAAERLHGMGIADVEVVTMEGPAASVIIGTVDSLRPDILVIGARGLGLWPGQQLGSVSMAVVQRVECPVLVVR